MPPKKKAAASAADGTAVQQKSPAEFFAENKNIAGFDNVREREGGCDACACADGRGKEVMAADGGRAKKKADGHRRFGRANPFFLPPQPGKCLYTSMRELVENSLDAAEAAGTLPDVDITVEEISQSRLNAIRGVANVARLDEELYHDFETEDQKKVCGWEEGRGRVCFACVLCRPPSTHPPTTPQKREAKEAKDLERAAKKGDDARAAKQRDIDRAAAVAAAKSTKTYYRLTVTDNGAGMPHDSIPDLLGRVLSGTKYGVCQTRGKFGLGAKMALIWSKLSTGLPIDVRSCTRAGAGVSRYVLDIDIHRNEPNVHSACVDPPPPGRWRGTTLGVTIEGSWTYARPKIMRYLRQIAVITPYAQFRFAYEGEGGRGSVAATFARRTDAVPPPPARVKHHPASVDLELVKRLLATTRAPTLRAFLHREFSCVGKAHADRLAVEARAGMSPDADPRTLDAKQAARLHQLLHEAKFDDPSGDHLSPAGEREKERDVCVASARKQNTAPPPTHTHTLIRRVQPAPRHHQRVPPRPRRHPPGRRPRAGGARVHSGGRRLPRRARRQAGHQRAPLRQPHPAAV